MKPRISRNFTIAICAIIFCLGIVTYSYAQNSAWEGFKIGEGKAYLSAAVNGEVSEDKIVLTWNAIDHPNFMGYKVVVSKNNANPKYPDDGYLYYITDNKTTRAVIDNHENYKNGDFGDKLIPGEKYYFSITTLYTDKTVPGDSLQMTYPTSKTATIKDMTDTSSATVTKEENVKETVQPNLKETPEVKAYADGSRIIVKWNPVASDQLQGYKVVISKNDASLAYPESGYLTYITNKNTSEWVIDNSTAYHNGDFGNYLVPGQAYYVSVTAVYNDSKVAGNTVHVTYPSSGYTPSENKNDDQNNMPVAISVTPSGSNLKLSWQASTAPDFEGYKVVISKNNPNPKYPDDGYLYWITDRSSTSVTVNADTNYKGDIQGNLVPGESYYFSISIIYQGWVIVPGPAQYVMFPQ